MRFSFRPPIHRRGDVRQPWFNRAGVVLALGASWVSLSPSLVPRTWWMTAASVTMNQLGGYALGVGLHNIGLRLSERGTDAPFAGTGLQRAAVRVRSETDPARRRGRLHPVTAALIAGAVLVTGAAVLRSAQEQERTSELVETADGGTRAHLVGYAVGTSWWLGGVGFGWVMYWIRSTVAGGVRFFSRDLVGPTAASVVGLGAVALTNRLLIAQVARRMVRRATIANRRWATGRRRPTEPERSGGPGSSESYDVLGTHGQAFVADGPRRADLEALGLSPQTAPGRHLEPIRVFAGKVAHDRLEDAAEAVVQELHRTGGFDRSVLVLLTGTGTGWIQDWTPAAVEYLTGGDCASATMQYSFSPSGLSFVVERHLARRAGRLLFERVQEELRRLPPQRRPRLYAAGESLGAYGGHSAFASIHAMLDAVDGAVWSGTPRATRLWSRIVADRDAGSTEILPVFRAGRHIRFANNPRDLDLAPDGTPHGHWRAPRIAYLQHPSDPVVWWSPSLIWHRFDWIGDLRRMHRRPDVISSFRWLPWVTFWQITTDMPRSISIPGGHGHSYHGEQVRAWARVLGIELTEDQERALIRRIGSRVTRH